MMDKQLMNLRFERHIQTKQKSIAKSFYEFDKNLTILEVYSIFSFTELKSIIFNVSRKGEYIFKFEEYYIRIVYDKE